MNFGKYCCAIEYIETYKIAYLHIAAEYGFTAILKFDNINTIKYFYEEFDFIPVAVKSNCDDGYILNYDEKEIIQDNYVYNAFVYEQSPSTFNIFIVDKQTRTLAFDITTINTKTSIFIEPFVIKRFTNIKTIFTKMEDLPENIRNYVTTQMTLITLKGQ